MKAAPSLLFCLLFGLGLATAQAQALAPVLSPQGYGQVKFGAGLDEAESALKQSAMPNKRASACSFVTFKKYPRVRFMVEDGIVTRADAQPGIKNSAGIAVGTSLAHVKRRYPHIQVRVHKYDDDGHYLILPNADGAAALVFEESGGKVMKVRAGLQPAVEYVEGCL